MNRQIAIHEAGHAVVAHALGIGGLHIIQTEHGYACGMDVPEDQGPLDQWVLAIVSASGAAAERVFDLRPGESADDDWACVCEHAAAWVGLDDVPEDDEAFEGRANTKTSTR